MKEITIKNKDVEVTIKQINEDIRWTEIYNIFMDTLKGLDYVSDMFDEKLE